MTGGLNRASHLLEPCRLAGEPRAGLWKENAGSLKGDASLLQERDLEMTSSAGGKGPRMPARSVGGLQPADGPVDLLLGGGPVPLSDGAGLPEEEAGLLGEGTEVGGADHA